MASVYNNSNRKVESYKFSQTNSVGLAYVFEPQLIIG